MLRPQRASTSRFVLAAAVALAPAAASADRTARASNEALAAEVQKVLDDTDFTTDLRDIAGAMVGTVTTAFGTMLPLGKAHAQTPQIVSDTQPERQPAGYTPEFGQQVRAYLLENPDVILEVFNLLERQEAAKKTADALQQIQKYQGPLFESTDSSFGDAKKGNPAGVVKVVEFFDYQCGYCKANAPELQAAMDGRNDVTVILKEFPILGPMSEAASRLALAIKAEHGDDAYIGFHNALLAQKGTLNGATLELLAGAAGFDYAALSQRGREGDITAKLWANKKLATDLNINGTPAFVFEDQLVGGMMKADRLAATFDRIATQKSGPSPSK